MSDRYDLCVIGAGTAGVAAADTALALGKDVLLVTAPGDLGGTCILRGCMPAKALLSATERLGEVEEAENLGIRAAHVQADLPAIVARRRELVDYFAEDRARELAAIPLVRGWARFVSSAAIDAGGRRIEAERFVISTGSTIVPPRIEGLAECGYFTSDGALEMTRPPRTLAILGAGPVGCEFAQYFARLGTRVTLIQSEAHVLRNEDPDVASVVADALANEGVDLRTETAIGRCARENGGCIVTGTRRGVRFELAVETIMVASERVPNISTLDLERAGIARRGNAILVDQFLRTTNDNVFVAGDALGRRNLVHVAAYAGKLAARNAFARTPEPAEFDRYEAHAIYTQPQVAVAGLTEHVCRERGLEIRVRSHPFSDIGKALVSDTAQGFAKMIADPGGRIVGIAIVGDDAIDLIGEAVALIDARATTRYVATMPRLHPTMGEVLSRVAEGFGGAGAGGNT